MIVPVVGNFGGPKAVRAITAYLKLKETPVFFTSAVNSTSTDGI
jgi:hypothetical protein